MKGSPTPFPAGRLAACLLLAAVFTACNLERGQSLEDLPTRVVSLEDLATAQMQTQNAPPPGFRESITFPQIDANLSALPNWRYEMLLEFNGVFSGTSRPATAHTLAQVSYNQLDSARRVLLEASGVLVNPEDDTPIRREGVRLGPDTYLVQENVCLGAADGAAAVLADLRAGDLIGGVQRAVPDGVRATINGQTVWRYSFGAPDLNLPGIRFMQGGRIARFSAELWIAPEHNAVIRFWLTMDIENAVLNLVATSDDGALPVSGQLILRYDLYDIGVNPNITQPFGC